MTIPQPNGSSSKRPNAIDLSHHVNQLSKSRHPSPLKDILKYMYQPDMLSLAGGLPHPSLFPYNSLSAEIYSADSFVDPVSCEVPAQLETIHVTKNGKEGPLNLTAALQYGNCLGLAPIIKFAEDFTQRLFHPAYADATILLNEGNTDGWAKVTSLLLDPGERILVEAHTYPTSMAHWIPTGVTSVALPMDGQGIVPEEMDRVLNEWDTLYPGEKKAHVLYTVPVGQNPTGATSGRERKQALYAVAVKHDIIIVEDDPYYFLQYDEYIPGKPAGPCESVDSYLDKLVPSYLEMDVEGRVIRLDTFSKTLAPGCRLGYFVCNPVFAERLLRGTEVTTQTPSGWSQSIVMGHLDKWGMDGYLTWLSNLCEQYRVRRDWLCEALAAQFDIVDASERPELGIQGTWAYFKGTSGKHGLPLFSYVCPTAGMFFWCQFYLQDHPDFASMKKDTSLANPSESLMAKIWMQLTQANVLLTPGAYYHPYQGKNAKVIERDHGHFRLAFSVATKPQLQEAIRRMEDYMIWLVPSPDDPTTRALHSRIKALAAEHSPSPIFQPHVTLLPTAKGRVLSELKEELRQALAHWKGSAPLRVALQAPQAGDIYFQAVIMPVDTEQAQAKALLDLRAKAEETTNIRPPSYFPHLSLLYSNLPKSSLERIAEEAAPDLPSSVDLTELWIVQQKPDVEAWHAVSRIYLSDSTVA